MYDSAVSPEDVSFPSEHLLNIKTPNSLIFVFPVPGNIWVSRGVGETEALLEEESANQVPPSPLQHCRCLVMVPMVTKSHLSVKMFLLSFI